MKIVRKRNLALLLSFVMMVTFATFSVSAKEAAKDDAVCVTVSGDTVFTFGPLEVAIPDGWELMDGFDEEEISYYLIGEETQGVLHAFIGTMDVKANIDDMFVETVIEPMFPDGIEMDEVENEDGEESFEYIVELDNGLTVSMGSGTAVSDDITMEIYRYTVYNDEVYFTMMYMIPEEVMENTDSEEIADALLSLQIAE